MRVLVYGASIKPIRYSNIAMKMLKEYNHEILAIGGKKGEVEGIEIQTGQPELEDIHTITLYVGPARQVDHYDYLLRLSPKRIIFNPGTENLEFERMCTEAGIYAQSACTLVLLRTGQFNMKKNSTL
jgi:predicted CoA-binding protein